MSHAEQVTHLRGEEFRLVKARPARSAPGQGIISYAATQGEPALMRSRLALMTRQPITSQPTSEKLAEDIPWPKTSESF